MYLLLFIVFVLGYVMIAFEHPLKIDKAASAILTGVIIWTVLLLGKDTLLVGHAGFTGQGEELIKQIDLHLLEHVGEIAQILFFLMAAMTIVELIDAYRGFEVVTKRITTTHKVTLLWLISFITFFFSAALDNLTTAIVMSALLKKLINKQEDLWFFGGMVIIAANAGGAWSPIGDVTTIMLWIGGQITAFHIIEVLFIPSLLCLVVPLIALTFILKGGIERPEVIEEDNNHGGSVTSFEQKLIFWLGVIGLLSVPIFKNVTHLPPFMGILFSLGVLWVTTEIIHRKDEEPVKSLSVAGVIQRIDTPSILFFLGILLAVAGLQTSGHLRDVAEALDSSIGDIYIINVLIGILSAVVDNVPLVAGAMGMYTLETYPPDHIFWELLAYCAGTGGSMLIIGSAAGVATMGILKIEFFWYLKKIGWVAALGYFAGFLYLYLLY
ncbi:MAG: sodium:proton antiporter NhaD [Microscillaceae bacterium]|nr:sodium:proton antiporter NhaD [Microscillaceae bacterium]